MHRRQLTLASSVFTVTLLHASVVVTRSDSDASGAWRSPDPARLQTFDAAGAQITLPRRLASEHSEARATPWGMAKTEIVTGRAFGVTYVVQATSLQSGAIPAHGIVRTKHAFAKSHKCTVETVSAAAMRTADSHVWPQIRFRGACAAPGGYETLSLIANGRWYELQVTNDPYVPDSVPERVVPASELPEALAWLAGHVLIEA